MNTSATVFVIDDDQNELKKLVRLMCASDYSAVTFESADAFLARIPDTMPGCLLLEVNLPDLDGLELQRTLVARGSRRPIIFHTADGNIAMSVRALKAGAVDFLTKPCQDKDLLVAIKQGLAMDKAARDAQAELERIQHRFAILTRREREVLGHVLDGRLNKQIAADLGTCEQTIKVHRMRITEKLQVRSVVELVRLSEKVGIAKHAPELLNLQQMSLAS